MATRPRTYKTEGIVLRYADIGEADRLLTLCTPDLGKLRAVARGVRKPSSHLAGHLEPLVHSRLLLAHRSSLDVVSQVETIEAHSALRADLGLLSYGIYVAELTDAFSSEGVANYPLFICLRQTLARLAARARPELAKGASPESLLRAFELAVLKATGYQPELGYCLGCQEPLEPRENFFSPQAGGTLCPQCQGDFRDSWPLTLGALKAMRFLLKRGGQGAAALHLKGLVAKEMERHLRRFIEYLLEKRLKSTTFLELVHRPREAMAGNEAGRD